MTRIRRKIEQVTGARFVGRLPHVAGGAFAAARLPALVAALRARLRPGQGARPGRPTNPDWQLHPKVPMSRSTKHTLEQLASRMSTIDRKMSPMQVAAHILEVAVAELEKKR